MCAATRARDLHIVADDRIRAFGAMTYFCGDHCTGDTLSTLSAGRDCGWIIIIYPSRFINLGGNNIYFGRKTPPIYPNILHNVVTLVVKHQMIYTNKTRNHPKIDVSKLVTSRAAPTPGGLHNRTTQLNPDVFKPAIFCLIASFSLSC